MGTDFFECAVGDCVGYQIGYIAGVVCLLFGIVLSLASQFFEIILDHEKNASDIRIEGIKEIKIFVSTLGYSIALVCLGAIMGVEHFSFKAFIVIGLMLYIAYTELHRPNKYPFQQHISFNKVLSFPISFLLSIWVIKGAFLW